MSDPRAPLAGQHEATQKILDVFHTVYNELGHGFLEGVYCRAMHIALQQSGLSVTAEVQIPVWFRGQSVGVFCLWLLFAIFPSFPRNLFLKPESNHKGPKPRPNRLNVR